VKESTAGVRTRTPSSCMTTAWDPAIVVSSLKMLGAGGAPDVLEEAGITLLASVEAPLTGMEAILLTGAEMILPEREGLKPLDAESPEDGKPVEIGIETD